MNKKAIKASNKKHRELCISLAKQYLMLARLYVCKADIAFEGNYTPKYLKGVRSKVSEAIDILEKK